MNLKLNGGMTLTYNDKEYEALFRQHYVDFCNYAAQFISQKQVIEDIVQNYFINIWEKRSLNLTTENFRFYSYRAIKNSCINHYKSEIHKESFLNSLAGELYYRTDDEENSKDYGEELKEALMKLPPKCRKIFLLKYITGLKYKEIAEICDISINTVKYHISEALRIMRIELGHLLMIIYIIFFT